MSPGDDNWRALVADAKDTKADMFLLNEMPFGPWLAASKEPEFDDLVAVQRLHEQGLKMYGDLGAEIVVGSHPVFEAGHSVIHGFVWERKSGVTPSHTKQFFPTAEGWYEDRWFNGGEPAFAINTGGGLVLVPVAVDVAEDTLPGSGERGDGERVGRGAGGDEPDAGLGAEDVLELADRPGRVVVVAVAVDVITVVGVHDRGQRLGAEAGVVVTAESSH